MSNELVLTGGGSLALPTYLQGADLAVSNALLATVGVGGNRIGLKGNRFRIIVNGKEEGVVEENYLDVIVVGAVPAISRIFYEGAYDQDTKAAPSCYSADGVAPAEDVKNKQASKCDMCPQNQVGSKIINGKKIKACSYFQRIVVMIAGDTEGTLYRVDVKAMGVFGDSKPAANKYNLRDYTKLINNRGIDVAALATRLSFDIDSSVPKLMFAAQRFITKEEYASVANVIGTTELENMLKISMTTVDLSGEETATETATPATVAAAVEEAPVVVEEAIPAADAEIITTPKGAKIKLTAKAHEAGCTYEEFVAEGWTPAQLVQEGYAEIVAPPPKPAAPKPAPPKPAAQAPKPTPPKPAAQAPTPAQKPATPTPAKPAGGPTIVKSAPPPTVSRTAPPPTTQTAVVEVQSDSEIDDILASLS